LKKKVVSAVATVAILSCAYAGTASASTYTVQKGDTLWLISKKYQTSVQDLKKINKLPSDIIRINQVLQVKAVVKPPVQTKVSADATTIPASTDSVYTVVTGDTLSGIASQYSISLSDLMKRNNLTTTVIFPGNQLKVAGGNVAASPPVPTGDAAQTPPSSQPVASTTDYIIKSGDTLGAIAYQFSCSVSDVKKLNNLSSDNIFTGQKLQVPAQAAPVNAPAQPADVSSTTDYVVTNGDTLGIIAAQFGVNISSIKKLNNLSSDLIYVGQQLKIAGQAVPTTTQPQQSNLASTVINEAKKLMGIPYVWGGSSNSGFDCSGFIYYVFNKAGFTTSRYNAEGFYSRSYYVDQPQAGDLVFFQNTYKKGISHLGIYLGDNQFIHADENRGIAITTLSNPYFKAHFDGFKRFY
jgi:LysM repeat protein